MKTKNTGLYIHIPFCSSLCSYCDFYSIVPGSEQTSRYIYAIEKEILKYNEFPEISTIFIGGGNPSFLNIFELEKLFKVIQKYFPLKKDLEYSIEANPETVTSDFLQLTKEYNVNRISIGVQSFNERVLDILKRKCRPDDVYRAIDLLLKYYGNSFNMDIIFGVPTQTIEEFENDINTAIKINPYHLSIYSLIIDSGTYIYRRIKNKEIPDVNDDLVSEMYLKLLEKMRNTKYEFYEVSNYGYKGHSCRHNENYWDMGEYLAFGASASGYYKGIRYKNISDVNEYIVSLNNDELPREFCEESSPSSRWIEYIMLSLRTKKGLNLIRLLELSELNKESFEVLKLKKKLNYFIENGYLFRENINYCCTDKGYLFLDSIISELVK